MPGKRHACPVCCIEGLTVNAPADQLKRETELRESFVHERLDHQPEKSELMDLTRFMHGGPGCLLVCPNCGVLRRDEDDSPHYETDVYDPELLTYLYPRYLRAFDEKRQYKFLLRNNAEILELGSHLGAFLQIAEQWGWRPIGLDIGSATSSFARRIGMSVKRLALEDYSPRHQPEAIFIWNCFEQLEDPSDTLHQSHRLLQSDGLLVVRVPNAEFYLRHSKHLRNGQYGRSLTLLGYNNLLGFPYRYGYKPCVLDRLLKLNGFKPIAIHNSRLLTPPYPNISGKIRSEWQATLRETESPSERGVSSAINAPWIEVVSRRVSDEQLDK
jgi:hypothetical protein